MDDLDEELERLFGGQGIVDLWTGSMRQNRRPDYQRPELWTPKKKLAWVKTVMEDYRAGVPASVLAARYHLTTQTIEQVAFLQMRLEARRTGKRGRPRSCFHPREPSGRCKPCSYKHWRRWSNKRKKGKQARETAMIWFTSDNHWDHPGQAARRGMALEEMNAMLIERWNLRVRPNDTVWVLGDVHLGKKPELHLDQLNGYKHLVTGNHDHKRVRRWSGWTSVHEHAWELKDNHQLYMLSHYGWEVWKNSHHGSFHLHGHSHGSLAPRGRRMDVGVDCHAFAPISLEEVRDRLTAIPPAIVDYHSSRMHDHLPTDMQRVEVEEEDLTTTP